MQFTGKVKFVSPISSVWENQTPIMYLVIEENEPKEYPDKIVVQFMGDRVERASRVNIWEIVTVYFSAKVKEANDGRHWMSLSWWRISREKKGEQPKENTWLKTEHDDDLPF